MAKLRVLSEKREIVKGLYKLAWSEANNDKYLDILVKILGIEKEIDDLENEIKLDRERGVLAWEH